MSRQHSHGTDWPHVEVLSPEEKLERVQVLPAPEPGVVVTVPLMLLPLYLKQYAIEPAAYRNHVLLVKKESEQA